MKKFMNIRRFALAIALAIGSLVQLNAQCQFTPDFAYSANPNGSVDFLDLSAQANPGTVVTNWQWTFSDGGTSNLQNPTHAFNGPGPYMVCLTVDFAGNGLVCQNTFCDSVLVVPPFFAEDCFNGIDDDGDLLVDQADPDCQVFGPCADFRTGFVTTIIPAVPGVSFLDQSVFLNGNGVVAGWLWDFGDGSTSTQQSPVHLYAAPGNYNVCLTATGDINGVTCTQTFCDIVTFGQPNLPCQADFITNPLNSNTFEFVNISTGGFTNLIWSFDDGFTSADYSPTHAFQQIGSFTVCLSIWDSMACQSFVCDTILVTAVDSTCYFTDCVFPGDANHDQFANMDDFLQIALGHGTTGLPRPNASLYWVGQSAPDWNTDINGINSKHADCNGDAMIDSFDIGGILLNYNHQHDGINPRTGNPPISLVFDQPVYNVGNGLMPTIGADIYAGDAQFPFADVYGLAFTMEYPNGDIEPGTVNVEYDFSSWLSHAAASPNIQAFKEIPDNNLTDVGFARTDHANTNGHGKIGRVTFIVSDDLVERAAGLTPLPITISGTRGIMANGQPVAIDGGVYVVMLDVATDANSLDPASGIRVFPNPADEAFMVDFGDTQVLSVELYDALGQRLTSQAVAHQQTRIDVRGLTPGFYMLRVNTIDGKILTKKVMVR